MSELPPQLSRPVVDRYGRLPTLASTVGGLTLVASAPVAILAAWSAAEGELSRDAVPSAIAAGAGVLMGLALLVCMWSGARVPMFMAAGGLAAAVNAWALVEMATSASPGVLGGCCLLVQLPAAATSAAVLLYPATPTR
ncbi:MAG: hypothetical protein HOV68_20195 [Streptomycetaceae bacterium]|nr:hypothetical protein [Streptomycetaceae bacterium]